MQLHSIQVTKSAMIELMHLGSPKHSKNMTTEDKYENDYAVTFKYSGTPHTTFI